jgi:hypothetical protein
LTTAKVAEAGGLSIFAQNVQVLYAEGVEPLITAMHHLPGHVTVGTTVAAEQDVPGCTIEVAAVGIIPAIVIGADMVGHMVRPGTPI